MLSKIETIACSVLLLAPVFSFQSAPQPGLLRITSNSTNTAITISVLDKNGNVDKNSKPVTATGNVSLVVTPGNYQVTAQSGSTTLKCSTTPAPAGSGQTITVSSGQATNVVCK